MSTRQHGHAVFLYCLSSLNIVTNNVSNQGSSQIYANFDLKVGTFNVHGQGKGQVKLRKVKNALNRGNFDILLLQETRSDGSE